jgi:5-(carboxyamino)imidazole ribonucleotide mutase
MSEPPQILPDPPIDPAVDPGLDPGGEPAEVVATLPATEPLAEVAADLEQLEVDAPRVAIVVSDTEDLLTLERARRELDDRGIRSEERVMSADEDPEAVAAYTENARSRGIRVIIAGAGPAARLPATVTVHTRLPVIGIPLTSQGTRASELGALLADRAQDVEEPIAWVGLDDAVGAAVLAARILDS